MWVERRDKIARRIMQQSRQAARTTCAAGMESRSGSAAPIGTPARRQRTSILAAGLTARHAELELEGRREESGEGPHSVPIDQITPW